MSVYSADHTWYLFFRELFNTELESMSTYELVVMKLLLQPGLMGQLFNNKLTLSAGFRAYLSKKSQTRYLGEVLRNDGDGRAHVQW